MAIRVESQPAYILHSRPYRDTSLIIDCLTADYGRVSAVIKGGRANSKAARQRRSSTQPFISLLLSWSGKTELKTLTGLEPRSMPVKLQGLQLFSAFYANELLTRLLLPGEPHTEVYTLYEWTLDQLLNDPVTDVVLRRFELQLLEYLGYGIDFSVDFSTGEPIEAGQVYSYQPEHGFQRLLQPAVEINPQLSRAGVFKGEDLLAIAAGHFVSTQARRVAKNICRLALGVHLGNRPLTSRDLFR